MFNFITLIFFLTYFFIVFRRVNLSSNQNLTPTFIFKKEMLTRYVVVIDDTKDMMERVCNSITISENIYLEH